MNKALPPIDLADITRHAERTLRELKNQHLFITGGTGFIGRWLLETLVYANEMLQLNLTVTILTRNSAAFMQSAPTLAQQSCFTFLEGDVRDVDFLNKKIDYIIHAATDASAKLNEEQPGLMFDTIVRGTRHMLQLARIANAKKFLYLSSGAVYGKQSFDVKQQSEDNLTKQHLNPHSVYGLGKLAAEELCQLSDSACEIKIARCYAFVGPYLPLQTHFAIGNFIQNGLNRETISINSDGSAIRSYLYAADLIIWLLHILCFGKNKTPYNVGSDEAISITDLAKLVAQQFLPPLTFEIREANKESSQPDIYVPSIERARKSLGVTIRTSLPNAIKKTIEFYS